LLIHLAAGSQFPHGPVYAVAQVQAGLADQPPAWTGRSVWVRGVAVPCPWRGGTARLWQCADDSLILVADPRDPLAEPLPLSPAAPTGVQALVRRLSLLHDLVKRSQAVPVDRRARFRVHVQLLAAQSCGGRSPCYEAVLQGAAP
jgi:hypothetical protein